MTDDQIHAASRAAVAEAHAELDAITERAIKQNRLQFICLSQSELQRVAMALNSVVNESFLLGLRVGTRLLVKLSEESECESA
jgi:hypothetical protein